MRAGNSFVVLKNSTEHAEPLFIALADARKHVKEGQDQHMHDISAFDIQLFFSCR